MNTVTIGTGITVGSDAFSILASALSAFPAVVVATGTVAIIIACVRFAASPNPDNFENTKAQVVRILIITVFLAMLGSVVSWVFTGMGGSASWLQTITGAL